MLGRKVSIFYPEAVSARKRLYSLTISKVKCWVQLSLPCDPIRNIHFCQWEALTRETKATKLLGTKVTENMAIAGKVNKEPFLHGRHCFKWRRLQQLSSSVSSHGSSGQWGNSPWFPGRCSQTPLQTGIELSLPKEPLRAKPAGHGLRIWLKKDYSRRTSLGGEMTQALYAHMNNKTIKKEKKKKQEGQA
jgi:hypothetical protein